MRRRAAFTLIELLVVIGILSMLLTIMLPNLGMIRERAQRISCGANLKAIGGIIAEYAAENQAYPATASDTSQVAAGTWVGPTGVNTAFDEDQAAHDLFNKNSGSKRLSPSASFFLLVRSGSLETGAFICGADRGGREYKLPTGQPRIEMTDFESMANVSYSVSYLWNDPAVNNVEWPTARAMPSTFALMSDISPVGRPGSNNSEILADDRDGNTRSHGQRGQNVLYADWRVKWSDNNRAGANGDNIFTRSDDSVPTSDGTGGSGANPVNTNDTVMCFYGR